MDVREPAVAGRFYTGDARTLAHEVQGWLAAAPGGPSSRPGSSFRTRATSIRAPWRPSPIGGCIAPSAWCSPGRRTSLGGWDRGPGSICVANLWGCGHRSDDDPRPARHRRRLPARTRAQSGGATAIPADNWSRDGSCCRCWSVGPILSTSPILPEPFLADPDSLVVLSTDLSTTCRMRRRVNATRPLLTGSSLAIGGDCRRGCLRCVSAAGSAGRGRAVGPAGRAIGSAQFRRHCGPHDRVVGYGAFTVGL